jgi:hypothetical protein
MDKTIVWLVASAGVAAVAAFFVTQWRERQRTNRLTTWVTESLTRRDGGPPAGLSVHCTADRNWPVLASFDDARTGARHRLQFACGGQPSTHILLAEVVDDLRH